MAEQRLDNSRPPQRLSLTEQELFDRLGWFTQVRWFMGLFSLLLLLVSWSLLGVHFGAGAQGGSLAPAADVVLLIFLYNAVFTFLLHIVRARGQITRRSIVAIALGQIACDTLAVCGLVHYTGGVENCFLILALLPLVIAAELLPLWLAYVTAGGAAVLVNALAWGEQRGLIPHISARWASGRAGKPFPDLHSDALYVLQVTVALTAMMFAIVFVGSTIAARLRRREEELEAAYQRLHQVDEAKGFFMRKAGHEMRAPLAAIYSILDAITHESADLRDPHLHLMQRAMRRTRTLMDLVRELRRYAALRSPEGLFQPKAICLDELVDSVVELFRPQAEAAGLRLTCRADPLSLAGDEEMLREVITNLVANAIQYTPPGGRIDVSLALEDGQAVLAVADTGIGISESARKHLFEEFFRSREAKAHFPDGTGLGLAITRRIVAIHGGRIDAAPCPGGGAAFTVRLPARSASDGP